MGSRSVQASIGASLAESSAPEPATSSDEVSRSHFERGDRRTLSRGDVETVQIESVIGRLIPCAVRRAWPIGNVWTADAEGWRLVANVFPVILGRDVVDAAHLWSSRVPYVERVFPCKQ